MMPSFEVTIAEQRDHLRVTTVGKYAYGEMFDFLARVRDEAADKNKNRVLIDSRLLEGNMTEAERFEGGQKIAQLFGARIKLALLMPPGTITKLGELAANNRGARFLVTSSEDEALAWLQG